MKLFSHALFFLSLVGLLLWWFSHAATFEQITWLIDPATDHTYVLVPKKYTKSASDVYIKTWMYAAFLELDQAAKKDGVELLITSGRRSFSGQQLLFWQYWFDRALPPGTSSHHFWQSIDLANTAAWWWAHERLRKHASAYWFCQTYDGHSSGQGEESWHYEYRPEEFRNHLLWFRDEIYVYLQQHNVLVGTGMSKQELFDRYVYPISHACIDDYPSSLTDPLTGIKFDRRLDSEAPNHLVYTLSRYKFPAWTGLLDILPPEIRFIKTDSSGLRFASLASYPTRVQDLFINYQQWFRDGVERFVLLRTYKQLVVLTEPKISYLGKK